MTSLKYFNDDHLIIIDYPHLLHCSSLIRTIYNTAHLFLGTIK